MAYLLLALTLFSLSAQAAPVLGRSFRHQLSERLPEALCDTGGFYSSCYDIEPHACKREARKVTERCLANLSLPTTLDLQTEGADLAAHVGRCVGVKLQAEWSGRWRDKPLCQTRSEWF